MSDLIFGEKKGSGGWGGGGGEEEKKKGGGGQRAENTLRGDNNKTLFQPSFSFHC